MATGDLVAELGGAELETLEAARAVAARQGARIHFGRLAHSERVLAEPREKADLGRRQRASAVDMESAAVRRWAADHAVFFHAFRVVLDSLEDRLPSVLPQGESFSELVRYAAGNLSQWPLLLSLALKQRKAMRALSRFLEELLPWL